MSTSESNIFPWSTPPEVMPWWNTFFQHKALLNYKGLPSIGTIHIMLSPCASMAKPKLHLLSFLFCSILLSFFHCTFSLINPEDEPSWIGMETEDINIVRTRRDTWKKCDYSVGKWVFDQSYPLYDSNCPYLSTAVACQKNGRPDSDYEKWKWKPFGCSIPRCLYYLNLDNCSHHHHIIIIIITFICMHEEYFFSLYLLL